jgi:hypothetical protein
MDTTLLDKTFDVYFTKLKLVFIENVLDNKQRLTSPNLFHIELMDKIRQSKTEYRLIKLNKYQCMFICDTLSEDDGEWYDDDDACALIQAITYKLNYLIKMNSVLILYIKSIANRLF